MIRQGKPCAVGTAQPSGALAQYGPVVVENSSSSTIIYNIINVVKIGKHNLKIS